jgi:hypothetical protein
VQLHDGSDGRPGQARRFAGDQQSFDVASIHQTFDNVDLGRRTERKGGHSFFEAIAACKLVDLVLSKLVFTMHELGEKLRRRVVASWRLGRQFSRNAANFMHRIVGQFGWQMFFEPGPYGFRGLLQDFFEHLRRNVRTSANPFRECVIVHCAFHKRGISIA